MSNKKFCPCQYKNPIELVCTDRKSYKKLFCKACAWDHPNKQSIKSFKEWETVITKDCDLQRLQNASTYSELYEALDQITEITKKELCKAVEKKCSLLKASLSNQINPIKRIAEAINNVCKKQYTADTVEFLVQELDCNNLSEQLNQLEATSYQQNKLVCKEIIDMANLVQKLINSCNQEQKVGGLGKISKSIQQKLDYKIIEENKQYIQNYVSSQNNKKIRITEIQNVNMSFEIQNEQQNKYEQQNIEPMLIRKRIKTITIQTDQDEAIQQTKQNTPQKRLTHYKTSTGFADGFYTTRQSIPSLNEFNNLSTKNDKNPYPVNSVRRNSTSKSLHKFLKK